MARVSNASPRLQETAETLRQRLLAVMPVAERHIDCAGIATAVVEGGEGTPLILLHGPFGHAAQWIRVIPALTRHHRVIAADLPGHGSTEAPARLDEDRILAWLRELIERSTRSPPWVVGQTLGGVIAARLASRRDTQIRGLVLVNPMGLTTFSPQPQFAQALGEFLAEANQRTLRALWQECVYDLSSLRRRFDPYWDTFEAYNLELARTPSLSAAVGAMMQEVGAPLTDEQLAQITVPTALICGRHDPVTSLPVSRSASERYGWPLTIIEEAGDEPPIEQPDAFVRALLTFIAEQR